MLTHTHTQHMNPAATLPCPHPDTHSYTSSYPLIQGHLNHYDMLISQIIVLLIFAQAVPTSKGQALADEYGIKFFETVSGTLIVEPILTSAYTDGTKNCVLQSAKTNLNVEQVFFSIARDIKQRLTDSDSRTEPIAIKINQADQAGGAAQVAQKSACCGT
uniref:RAB GTPase-like protein A5B n=1 Tax=Rhizophora mucronata TaxID=61149 RepID=A0A2P2K7D9_RHIMU